MTKRLVLALAAIPLLLQPLGCAHPDELEDPAQTRDGEAPLEARRIELTVPADHASPEELHALVEHIEGQAEVAEAKVAVHKSSETGEASVEMTVWGRDMPTDEELVADLRAQFPYLGPTVLVSPVDTEAEPAPHDEKLEDPELMRQRIIDDLRAKGVEGEIDVTITDHPDGRREVEVKVHDDEPPPT